MEKKKKKLTEVVIVVAVLGLIAVSWALFKRHNKAGDADQKFIYQDF